MARVMLDAAILKARDIERLNEVPVLSKRNEELGQNRTIAPREETSEDVVRKKEGADKVAENQKKPEDVPIKVYSSSTPGGLALANPSHGDYSLTERLATGGAATGGESTGLSGLGCWERRLAIAIRYNTIGIDSLE